MSKYVELYTEIPQTMQADPRQVPNSAGGYGFEIDCFERLDRFLILGSQGSTYYASARKLTIDNAACVEHCLKTDGRRTVQRIVNISNSGRAPRNEPAIFALALCFVHGDDVARREARGALPLVCRTGSHLFQFVSAISTLGGWGRGNKRAVADWYLNKGPGQLAYQLLKYQSRDGWSHRDVLRLVHAQPKTDEQSAVMRWAVARKERGERTVQRRTGTISTYAASVGLPTKLADYDELVASTTTLERVVSLIGEHGYTHEMVPNQHLAHREVWEALLDRMPMGALLRNLGQLTARGIIAEGSAWASAIAQRLTTAAALHAAMVHPLSVLSAAAVYRRGSGEKGKLTWTPVQQIRDALESAFYLAFGTVQVSGKRLQIALDVSGSMDCGEVSGCPGLTPREASAVMAMAVARSEPDHEFTAFTSRIVPLPITADMRLDQVVQTTRGLPHGATDCAQPMLWALRRGKVFDGILILTDNESWSGPIHVHTAMQRYRQDVPHAKLVAAALTATEFSVVDPADRGGLNVVGLDAAAPRLIADFLAGSFAAQ